MGFLRTDVPRPSDWPPPRAPDDVRAAWTYAPRRDPVGHTVHTALAGLHLLCLPLFNAATSITFAALLVYACLRVPSTWPATSALLRRPISWTMLAWAAWVATSLAWSDHPAQGVDELAAARALLLPVLLWPVLDRLPCLIAAALIGVAVANIVQIAQLLELVGLTTEAGGRARGMMHPIETGAWCVAASCWHLGAALTGRGALRWISLAGLTLAVGGLLATGSRGPWLAAALVIPALLVTIAWRRPPARPATMALILAMLLGGIVLGPRLLTHLRPRLGAVAAEIAEARDEGQYATSVGLRIGLWSWTWKLFRAHPVIGVGAGDFETEVASLPEFEPAVERALDVGRVQGEPADEAAIRNYLSRAHAHSTYLHTLARLGLVGGLILATMLAAVLAQCARDPADHAYEDGMLFVVLAWMIGAQFDCYELNGNLFGLLGLAIGATWTYRPAVRAPFFRRATGRRDERRIGAREPDEPC